MSQSIPETPIDPTPTLSVAQRAARVLVSHGRAAGLLNSFPSEVQAELAAFCDDGLVKEGSWDAVEQVMHDYWDSQKATVDPEFGSQES